MSTGYRLLVTILIACLSASFGCSRHKVSEPDRANRSNATQNVFDAYMNSDVPPADGFDWSVGDENGQGSYSDKATGKSFVGWYVATHFNEEYSLGIHTGEDWNGNGGGNTDLGQDVHAIANGRVSFAQHCGRLWGNVVMIEHDFYENHERRKILSLYAHLLEIKVRPNQIVRRREVIATVGQDPEKLFNAHLHLELRWDDSLAPTFWPSSNGKDQAWVKEHYAAPSEFIQNHRQLPIPQRESRLVLVDQTSYRARFYESGLLRNEYDVSFGQGHGQKLVEGDNKTPKGMYFVIQKHRGNFDGPYGDYYGGHWIKINYPNKYDAFRGYRDRMISQQQQERISSLWAGRQPTLESTRLGGGIGFHGWIREWDNAGPRHLSWGCVVMHLKDIDRFYDQVSEGTMVVIF